MGLTLVTAPPAATTVLSVADAKDWLEIDPDDNEDNPKIEALIGAVVDHIDGRRGILGRSIRPTTWDYTLDCWPAWNRPIRLPLPPLISVAQVQYVDTAGTTQTLSSSVYDVFTTGLYGEVRLAYQQSWPSIRPVRDAITVRFKAGYSDNASPEGTDPPRSIVQAVKLILRQWYDNPSNVAVGVSVQELPQGAQALLHTYRLGV